MSNQYLSIGQAAEFLDVSIDTLRRWEEKGKITSERLDGKNRSFLVSDLEKLKFGDRLNIKDASERLNISQSTLRRLADEGKIKSQVAENGYREFKVSDLEEFVALDTKSAQEALAGDVVHKSQEEVVQPSARAHFFAINKDLSKARFFGKSALVIIIGLLFSSFLIFTLILGSFFMNPRGSAKFFNLAFQPANGKNVLGMSTSVDQQKSQNIASAIFQGQAETAVKIIRAINPPVVEGIVLSDEASSGLSGKQGDRGIQGEKGDVGISGATGSTGSAGDTGATGSTGATGATGPSGSFSGSYSSSSGLQITAYGTGAGETTALRFYELSSNGSDYVGFKSSDSVTTTTIWTLPSLDGTSGQCLTTNGSGVFSFASCAAAAITSLNGLTGSTQTFATGTTGSDFNISSSGTIHTFSIPNAGAAARGLVSTGTQTLSGNKTFTGNTSMQGLMTFGNDSADDIAINSAALSFNSNTNFYLPSSQTALAFGVGVVNLLELNTLDKKVGVFGDYSSSSDARQLTIQSHTDNSRQLALGFNTSGLYGSIQALIDPNTNTGTKLLINPLGGNVGVGGDTTPDSLFNVGSTSQFQINSSGAIVASTGLTTTGAITAPTSTNTINGLIINSGALSGITGMTFISGGIDLASGGITNAGSISGATGLTSSGTVTFSGLTASRALFTTTGGQLTNSGTSQYLIDSLSDETGTGNLVFSNSPTLVTPSLGVATATSINGQTISSTANFTGTMAVATSLSINGGTALTTTNQTGTGSLVLASSPSIATPTFTTSATTPLVIGGTGTISTLTLKSTSGSGTTGSDIVFQTGNNGATEGMRILNSGDVGIGTSNPNAKLSVAGTLAVGSGDGGTPTAATIRGAAASGNDIVGASLTFDASNGTGFGGSGSLIFRTASPGTNNIAFDANSTGGGTTDSVFSWSHTTTASSNRLLLVTVKQQTGDTSGPSSITYNGQNLTRKDEMEDCINSCNFEIWYLTNPSTGTNTVTVTYGSSAFRQFGATTFYNVDQTTPLGSVTSSRDNSGTSASINVTTTSKQVVFDALAVTADSNPSVGSNQTKTYTLANGNNSVSSSYKSATGSTTTMNWTFSSSFWAYLAVPINVAADSSTNSLTSRLNIDQNGNVGVGASSQFQVNSSGAIAAVTGITSSGNVNANAGLDVDDVYTIADGGLTVTVSDNFWQGLGASSGRIEFDDQSTDEVNILSANVGIGTTTPDQKVVVRNDIDGLTTVNVWNNTNASGARTALTLGNNTSQYLLNLDVFSASWVPSGSDDLANGSRLLATGDGGLALRASHASGKINFFTGSTLRMGITSAGSIGVGTSAPLYLLDLRNTATTPNTPMIAITDPTNNRYAAGIGFNNATRMSFYSGETAENGTPLGSGQERMVIKTDGNVGVGNTDPGVKLHVGSSSVTDATNLLRLEDANSSCNFTADSGSPSCGSDETLKKDVSSLDTQALLSRIAGLRPVSYHWKTDEASSPIQFGFIAQEVAEKFPELVKEGQWIDGSTKKFLNMGGLMPYVIGAVKEQQLQIEKLESGLKVDLSGDAEGTSLIVDGLNGKLALLESRITNLEKADISVSSEQDDKIFGSAVQVTSEDKILEYLALNAAELANYKLWKIGEDIVLTGKIAFTNSVRFLSDVTFKGNLSVNSSTTGSVTIPSQATKVRVTFQIPFDTKPIVNVTLQRSLDTSYVVEDITKTGFVISIDKAQEKSITFNWIALISEGEESNVEVLESLSPTPDPTLTPESIIHKESSTSAAASESTESAQQRDQIQ